MQRCSYSIQPNPNPNPNPTPKPNVHYVPKPKTGTGLNPTMIELGAARLGKMHATVIVANATRIRSGVRSGGNSDMLWCQG